MTGLLSVIISASMNDRAFHAYGPCGANSLGWLDAHLTCYARPSDSLQVMQAGWLPCSSPGCSSTSGAGCLCRWRWRRLWVATPSAQASSCTHSRCRSPRTWPMRCCTTSCAIMCTSVSTSFNTRRWVKLTPFLASLDHLSCLVHLRFLSTGQKLQSRFSFFASVRCHAAVCDAQVLRIQGVMYDHKNTLCDVTHEAHWYTTMERSTYKSDVHTADAFRCYTRYYRSREPWDLADSVQIRNSRLLAWIEAVLLPGVIAE